MNANPRARSEAAAVRFRSASPRTALALGVAMLLVTVAAVPLAFVSGATQSGLPLVPFGVVGYLVARRQPRNPLGWILLGLGFTFVLASDAGSYSFMVYRQGYHLPLARAGVFLTALWIWVVIFGPLPFALFPDGRVSERWRRIVRGYVALGVIGVAVYTWSDNAGIGARQIRVDSTGELVSNGAPGWVGAFFAVPIAAFYLASAIRQVANYRRSRGERRQQLKCLLSGGAIAMAGLLLTPLIGGGGFLAVVALPIGMGVGILKYRLYDIDRLISRTLSYALLTAMLAGVFVGIVVLATDVLPFSSPVAVAASTLAAAALFNPLRRRIQRLVDRRFNRARYDADAIVAAFRVHVQEAVDLDALRYEFVAAVEQAVQPAHASVWVRPAVPRSA